MNPNLHTVAFYSFFQAVGCVGALRLNKKLLRIYWTTLLALLVGDVIVGTSWMFRLEIPWLDTLSNNIWQHFTVKALHKKIRCWKCVKGTKLANAQSNWSTGTRRKSFWRPFHIAFTSAFDTYCFITFVTLLLPLRSYMHKKMVNKENVKGIYVQRPLHFYDT